MYYRFTLCIDISSGRFHHQFSLCIDVSLVSFTTNSLYVYTFDWWVSPEIYFMYRHFIW